MERQPRQRTSRRSQPPYLRPAQAILEDHPQAGRILIETTEKVVEEAMKSIKRQVFGSESSDSK